MAIRPPGGPGSPIMTGMAQDLPGTAAASEDADGDADGHITPARLQAFSDGVIAIAATLLVLDVRAPAAGAPVWPALGREWPALTAYVTSFLVIGIAWIHHHNLFHHVRRVDRTLLFLNLGMLMVISFLPVPTATLGGHLGGPGAPDAAVLYALSLGAASTWFFLLWNHLCAHPELMPAQARERAVAARRRSLLGPLVYLAAAGLALVSPLASVALDAALVLYFIAGRRSPATRTRWTDAPGRGTP